jgi:ketosteroid isomerase-like protein
MADTQQGSMINALNRTLADAFKANDFTDVANMFSDDAVMLPPRRNIITGRKNIQSYWAKNRRLKELSFESVNFTPLGSAVARDIGTLRMHIEPGRARGERQSDNGGVSEVSGKYVLLWRKIGDDWKLETSIWNVTLPSSDGGEGGGRGRRRRARE